MPSAANRLIHEKSPYLLQHAGNPVDWFPWGEEAFAKARSEDRLIFLSIGYATCHWCHVMEHESFENETVARVMNDRFVSIKVDREELPDVDSIYMTALGAMGQAGGWPLNMFLTPDLRPIAGGTYFPSEPRWGRPSFSQILTGISDLWKKDRSRILETARVLHEFLTEKAEHASRDEMPPENLPWLLPEILEGSFDNDNGGFLTAGPNKFPPFLSLMLLLRLHRRQGEERLIQMVEKTLDGIRRGGIYDQIGGGLCRYSTDHHWLVPHFEKMLYDNALFVQTLVEAFRVTQKIEYRKWALQVLEYIERDMTTPEGAFCTAEDADSEGEEGRFYLWSDAEFHSVLQQAGFTSSEVKILRNFWGVTAGGNFEGSNILHEKFERVPFAKDYGVLLNDLEGLIDRGARALLAFRARRIRPFRDDKVLLSWNAMMISALARASLASGRRDLAVRGEKACNFLFEHLRVNGTWKRRYRDGEARFEATLSDHALLGLALLDLFRATGVTRYYSEADNLARIILGRFIENNQIYETSRETSNLILRPVDCYDGVMPSGPSATVQLFASLRRYGSSVIEYDAAASLILRQFRDEMERSPQGSTAMLSGWLTLTDDPVEIAITGKARQEAIDWIGANLEAETIFAWKDGTDSEPGESIPLLAEKEPETFAIYLCRDLACMSPVHSLLEFTGMIRPRQ